MLRHLSLPADAAALGRGAAAQLRRRADRRLAQHADRRPRRNSRAAIGSSTRSADRTARCSSRCARSFRCGCSASRRARSASTARTTLTFDASETHLGDAIEQARQELDARSAVRARRAHATAPTTRARRSATSCCRCARSRCRSSPSASARSGSTRTSRSGASRRRSRCCKGGTLVADLMIRQRGYCGQKVPLVVEDGGRIVSRDSITLPPDGDVAPVRVSVVASDAGPRSLTFRIPLQPGEQVDAEQRSAGARRRARRPREDSVRRRRAAVGDAFHPAPRSKRTRISSSSRSSARPKTSSYGSNVDSADELRRAVSRRRAPSCFAIARSSSATSRRASSRTTSSRCSRDFVNVRGGGLLMLGGRRCVRRGRVRRHAARRRHAGRAHAARRFRIRSRSSPTSRSRSRRLGRESRRGAGRRHRADVGRAVEDAADA